MANILHIIHELSLGGAARSMVATAKYSSRAAGHRHTVLSLQPPQPRSLDLAREAGMRVVVGCDIATAHAEMAAADIVQIHWWNVPEMHALLTSRLPAMRLMHFYHVAGDGIPHIITSHLAGFADLNVPCNPYSYRELDVFARMDEAERRDKVAMVYDAADFERVAGLEKAPHAGFIVGYIGTVDFVKMHPRYVEMSAAVRVQDARFVVCGEGGALPVLREKASAAGQSHRFDFRGWVSDIRPVLATFDAYGYPLCEDTYAAAELNLQEVMHAGVPPVVFPYGGVRSLVVHDYTGLVVHSEAEYAEAIEYLHRHPDERARIGANAATYARQIFGAENAARKMDALYERLLRRSKRERIWPGPARDGRDGAMTYLDTLGDFGAAFHTSRSGSLREALRAEEEIASSSRLAFLSGIGAYRSRFPADPWLRYWAGLVFEQSGSPIEAAGEFTDAINAGFPHWRAWWRLARAARAMGREDLAGPVEKKLEERYPLWRRELEEAGRQAAAPGVTVDAQLVGGSAEDFAPASGSDWVPGPESEAGVDPKVLRAEAAFNEGRLGEAERLLQDHLAAETVDSRALNDLGVVQHRQGRKDLARKSFLEAVKADNGNSYAVANLSESLREAGFHQEALGLCYRLLDTRPDNDALLRAAAAVEEDWADKLLAKSIVRDLNYIRKPYRVTALVSTYKSEAFMRECLEDLEGQTLAADLEIIVVDADSPQGENAIVEEFQRRYTNIRYIRTPERIGIYPAWNIAVRASSGAFLTPFSTNDRLAPDAYDILRRALEERPDVALVYGDSHLTNLPHQKWGSHVPSPDYGGAFRWPEYSFEDLITSCRVGPHPMWRREIHKEVGYFDGRYRAIGDQDFWLRIGIKKPLLHIPVFTGIAWITKDSLSGESSSLQEIQEIHIKHSRAYLERVKRSARAIRGGSPTVPELADGVAKPASPAAGAAASNAGDKYLVSAIVSTYNSERHIRGCLEDLVTQTLFRSGRMEVIVVDSGSEQAERRIVEEFQALHPAIVYVRTARETLYSAWNRAVHLARGRYLITANTDDRHRSDACERLARALQEGGRPLAYCDALLTKRENETFAANTADRVWSLPSYNARQALIDCPFGCTVMWRRELHAAHGMFGEDYRIAGDYEFFLRAALAGGATHVREALTLYLESPSSLSYASAARVEEEVNRFIVALRRSLPLERIYPFLDADGSPEARAAAAMDFGAQLINPFMGRPSPAEAERLFRLALEWVGPRPEILLNLGLALSDLGRMGEASECFSRAADQPGWSERLRSLAALPRDRALARLSHPGLDAMPRMIPVAETRIPVADYTPSAETVHA